MISGISSRQGSHQLAKKFIINGLPRKLVSPTELPSTDFRSKAIAERRCQAWSSDSRGHVATKRDCRRKIAKTLLENSEHKAVAKIECNNLLFGFFMVSPSRFSRRRGSLAVGFRPGNLQLIFHQGENRPAGVAFGAANLLDRAPGATVSGESAHKNLCFVVAVEIAPRQINPVVIPYGESGRRAISGAVLA